MIMFSVFIACSTAGMRVREHMAPRGIAHLESHDTPEHLAQQVFRRAINRVPTKADHAHCAKLRRAFPLLACVMASVPFKIV